MLCMCVQDEAHQEGTRFGVPPDTLFTWTPRTADMCSICQHFQTTYRGGRCKKQTYRGRLSCEHTIEVLCEMAGEALASGISPSRLVIQEAHILCVLCQCIARRFPYSTSIPVTPAFASNSLTAVRSVLGVQSHSIRAISPSAQHLF